MNRYVPQDTDRLTCTYLSDECNGEAIAEIPLPSGQMMLGGKAVGELQNKPIYCCESCAQKAITKNFYVRRYDETESIASTRFDKNVREKHALLRGTQKLKYEPRAVLTA